MRLYCSYIAAMRGGCADLRSKCCEKLEKKKFSHMVASRQPHGSRTVASWMPHDPRTPVVHTYGTIDFG